MRPRVWLIFSHLIISLEHLKSVHQGRTLSRLVVFFVNYRISESPSFSSTSLFSDLYKKYQVSFP